MFLCLLVAIINSMETIKRKLSAGRKTISSAGTDTNDFLDFSKDPEIIKHLSKSLE
jgi:hypothetical protein